MWLIHFFENTLLQCNIKSSHFTSHIAANKHGTRLHFHNTPAFPHSQSADFCCIQLLSFVSQSLFTFVKVLFSASICTGSVVSYRYNTFCHSSILILTLFNVFDSACSLLSCLLMNWTVCLPFLILPCIFGCFLFLIN